MFPISSRIVNSIRPVCSSQLRTVVSVRGSTTLSGFVGCDTIPEYPDVQEFFDRTKVGYWPCVPAVSEMSYGNIKCGSILPLEGLERRPCTCKLAKLFGHGGGGGSDILIRSLPIYYYKIFKSRWAGLMQSDDSHHVPGWYCYCRYWSC